MNMNIVESKSGDKPCISIDGKNISARDDITIEDGVVYADGVVKAVIYGSATIFTKSGEVSIS